MVLPDGFDRVHHFHIRKTAGTSLNSAFWSLVGADLAQMNAVGPRLERDGLVFLRHDPARIESGDYFFANSHAPFHRLVLAPRTFTVTVLRDPVDRVVSLYQYLHGLAERGRSDGTVKAERAMAAGSFGEFLAALPPDVLKRQLFTFSPQHSVDEGLTNIATVDEVLFTEDFANGIDRLGRRLGLPLPLRQERRFPHETAIDPDDLDRARARLASEYAFVDAVRAERD